MVDNVDDIGRILMVTDSCSVLSRARMYIAKCDTSPFIAFLPHFQLEIPCKTSPIGVLLCLG